MATINAVPLKYNIATRVNEQFAQDWSLIHKSC